MTSKIWEPSNVLPGAEIGEGTSVGAFSEIGGKVGKNCKIQAFVFIPKGVVIEDNVFVGPHVCFTNDKRPRYAGEWVLLQTRVETGVSIGANATILPGITLGENSVIGAGAVVTKDVPEGETWIGNPAHKLE